MSIPLPPHPGAGGQHALSAVLSAVLLALERDLDQQDGADLERLADWTYTRRTPADDSMEDE